MRKPRDYDAELIALNDKTKQLRARKTKQLGELVAATGAGILPLEYLTGALLAAAEMKDEGMREVWRQRGAAFFQAASARARRAAPSSRRSTSDEGGAASPSGENRA